MAMPLSAELYWSFRSPYSYLAARRYVEMIGQYDLIIDFRPVYPLAIRELNFFERNHPKWLGYVLRDIARLAMFLDIPFGPPCPDPIVQDLTTRKIAAEQPYIYRITRLGQLAAELGQGLEFADAVSRLIWGGVADWDQGEHLAQAAKGCGFDLSKMDRRVQDEAERLDRAIADNQAVLEAAGHWGVPTLVYDGEPFFGQDRIELALWRMQQNGLKRRG